ncbi:MAG: hypothetical protein ABSB30_06460 [Terracidiphilus sp.]|jgi:hypothetical protein
MNAASNAFTNSISNSISSAISNAFNQSRVRAEQQAAAEEQQRLQQQQLQQVIQQVDALSRHNIQVGDELLRKEAEEARKLDDRQRADTLSNLQGICPTDGQLALKPSTDLFGQPGNPTGATSNDVCAGAAAPAQPAPPPAVDTAAFPPAPAGVECKWGDQSASTVDLRCLGLDTDKPIVIDPHVVRGQERVFPAQIDPATFENAHYNNGFSALMRPTDSVKDAMDAVSEFQIAKLQRPNDPMVRNGLGLAQDILKWRRIKEQDDKSQAEQQLCHGIAALMLGDMTTARNSVMLAQKLDPTNDTIGNWSITTAAMSASFKTAGRDVKTVEMLVGNALVAESQGNYAAETKMLEMAKSLAPGDKYVTAVLDHARYLEAEFPVHNAMHP